MTEKHKVFVSYYHKEDQKYKEEFEKLFSDILVSKSVNDGDINSDNSDEYIKQLIKKEFISDSSVVVVLIGANTKNRKHVDWEIYACLDKKSNGYSGLLGICLPTHPAYNKDYSSDSIPPRFEANMKTKYTDFFDWTTNVETMKKRIQIAFDKKIFESDKIDNSLLQFKQNR